ncbi:hemagglutinin repeat-containing protein [Mycetohabitans sp. B7]|uniref:two-partner secretion domain-containing protein n=1 Tax=Mycetohabitans sp. B7 TaxID=2841844 RepID=UPI001F3A9B5A|nr:hemagglutinin repeat-containing protein [Mycetohabitans sp. B7]MCG1039106.1 hemagglutinin repeat-containing protein [Mycetohabitans sp. B7]
MATRWILVGVEPVWRVGRARFVALWLSAWPAWGLAQIVPAPGGETRVIQTQNGLPQVDIARPSGAGVSVNHYHQFDVQAPGAILNNASAIVKTGRAGYINGNPHFGPNQSARLIVNEVHSLEASQLRGPVEVAGPRAEVVVANPSGIIVNGGGFINTSRATLTTGQPYYGADGSLAGFNVSRGLVTVHGAKFNALNIDQVDLIARAVQVNTEIRAKNLNVVSGANQVPYATLAATTIQGDGPAPSVSIDVGQLGGMYADRIVMVGTEHGVGVHSAGTISAQAGDLTLCANGKLTLTPTSQTNASGLLSVRAQADIQNDGKLYGKQDVSVSSASLLSNVGTLAAQRNLKVEAHRVNSSGGLGAGADADGVIDSAGELEVKATGSLVATGHQLAGGNMTLEGAAVDLKHSNTLTDGHLELYAKSGDIDLTGAEVVSQGTARIIADDGVVNHNQGKLSSGDTQTIRAAALLNQDGQIFSESTLDIDVAGKMDNLRGLARAAGRVLVKAGSLDNTAGRVTSKSDDELSVTTVGPLTNAAGHTVMGDQGGVIGGNGNVKVQAGTLTNRGRVTAKGMLKVSGQSINNNDGTLSAKRLDVTADSLTNEKGVIAQTGKGDTVVRITHKFDNTLGTIRSNGENLTLKSEAGSLTNNSGTLYHGGSGTLKVTGASTLTNLSGLIDSASVLNVDGQSIDNTGGVIRTKTGSVTLTSASTFKNNQGVVQGGNGLEVSSADTLFNQEGKLVNRSSTGTLAVSAQELDNTNGQIADTGTVHTLIKAASLHNANTNGQTHRGVIRGKGNVTIDSAAVQNGANGQIVADRDLTFKNTDQLTNAGQLTADGMLTVEQPHAVLSNVDGQISATKVKLTVASLDNTSGQIANPKGSSGDITIQTGVLTQHAGTIASARDLKLSAVSLIGDGQLIGGRDAAISLQDDYTHGANNQITANRNLTFSTTGQLTNTGKLSAVGNLTTRSNGLINRGEIRSGIQGVTGTGITTLEAGSGELINEGKIDGHAVTTTSQHLTNTGSIIGGTLTHTANTIVNDGARAVMAGTQQVNLYGANTVTNRNGATLVSLGDLNIAKDDQKDASGRLINLIDTVNNLSSTMEAHGLMNIAARQLNNIRQNVQTETRSSSSTHTMRQLPWWRPSPPGSSPAFQDANVHMHHAYYVNPADIISSTPILTPDGYWVTQLVVNLPWNASVFEWKNSGLYQTQYQQDWRVTLPAGQVTLYAYDVKHGQSNPDQQGGTAWDEKFSKNTYLRSFSNTAYSNHYGNCTTDCVRIETYPGYTDPNTQFMKETERRREGHWPVETQRIAHQTVTETELSPNSGAPALLTSGAAMNLTIGELVNNDNGTIAAGGDLNVNGQKVPNGHGAAVIKNTSTQLTKTYSFTNQSGYNHVKDPYPGTPAQWVTWTNPSITFTTGIAGGTVTSNQAVTIDAGETRNISVQATPVPVGADAAALGLPDIDLKGQGVGAPRGAKQRSGTPGVIKTVAGVRTSRPQLKLPTSGLFTIQSAPNHPYLVVTDPRFTSYTQFVSSDYMLGQLDLNPQTVQKRIGDGYYESQLVMAQVTQLTGKRYLEGFTSNEDEYKQLMTHGAVFGKQFSLKPGIALTDAQMEALTTDIVWLVNQTITLADGSQQTVLAPQVYLAKSNHVDVTPSGALISGNTVQIKGTDIVNQGGTIAAKGDAALAASNDIQNLGGAIHADNLALMAGRDIINQSLTRTEAQHFTTGTSTHTSIGALGTLNASGEMLMQAGHDLTVKGARVTTGGNLGVMAGHAVNIGTVETGSTIQTHSDARNTSAYQNTTQVGSALHTGGSLGVASGGDIGVTGSTLTSDADMALVGAGHVTIRGATNRAAVNLTGAHGRDWAYDNHMVETNVASQLSTGGSATVVAGQAASGKRLEVLGSNIVAGTKGQGNGAVNLAASGDVTIAQTRTRTRGDAASHSEADKFLSSSSTDTARSYAGSNAHGSLVSGETVSVSAGHDLNVRGSAVVSTHGTALAAANNVNIGTAQSTAQESNDYRHRQSGLLAGDGLAVTIGSRAQSDQAQSSSLTHHGSVVGSVKDSVTIEAGNELHVKGSDLIAAKDVVGTAKTVTLQTATDEQHHSGQQAMRQSGVTLGIQTPGIAAVNNVVQQASAGAHSQDDRVRALRGLAGASGLYDAYQSVPGELGTLAKGEMPEAKLTVSIGSSGSRSVFSEDSTQARGNRVQAGGLTKFQATGEKDPGQGNVIIRGSQIDAQNVHLAATDRVDLLNSTDTERVRHDHGSTSGSVGVSIGTKGLGVSASAARANGDGNSDGAMQNNTHVRARESVTIKSGGDTNVVGANVKGNRVVADVQGDLNVASVQDTSVSAARQHSAGVGLNVSQGGGSASFNVQNGNARGNYASVTEQAGIEAGEGGFDIAVKGNTDLKGAFIASEAVKAQNRLKTGTLSYSAIENHSDYQASTLGISGGATTGDGGNVYQPTGSSSGKNAGGASPLYLSESGSSRARTQSAISAAEIEITNPDQQKQAIAGLNRDATNLNGRVDKTPDVQQSLQNQGELMSAMRDAGEAVARRIGDVADAKRDALLQAASESDDPQQKQQYLAEAEQWGESGRYRVGLQSAGGSLVGGIGGGLLGAAQSGAGSLVSALLANKLDAVSRQIADQKPTGNADLDKTLGNIVANVMSSVAGGVIGGTQGAQAAYNVDRFNRQLHLEEKQRIRELAGKDEVKEARLAAAACAMAKCYAEYPEDSAAYQHFKQIAEFGASDALADERRILSQQDGLFGYTTSGLFSDANIDAAKQWNNTYQFTSRGAGAAQATLGAMGVAGAVASAPITCTTGLGCVANAFVAGTSADVLIAGAKQTVSGQPESTYLNQALTGLGLSPGAASLLEAGLGLGSAVTAGAVANAITDRAAALNKLSAASYKEFVTDGVKMPPEMMQSPQAQALMQEIRMGNPGMSQKYIEEIAQSYIESGTSLPRIGTASPGAMLVKVVPKGDSISPYSGYWLSPEQARAIATMTPEQAGQILGLPATQAANMMGKGVDYYAITPKAGIAPNVFVSEVAGTSQGMVTMPGGAQQVIVPNRGQWIEPFKINPFTLR